MELVERLAKHLDRDGLVQRLQALVRIPSVTGGEDAAQAEVIRMLRDLGGGRGRLASGCPSPPG